ncbi:maleylacetate reductase [Rhizobium sp. CSW-27]|uniref:maleylacetate reductase n=1 Tax=Rhizobium sp. CSW-27 TaxID=2839985 RepID=UPI001C009D27|nr:maleylacetate reductase [Rhizobium sp. CSW-27]MBT9370844.1 maleylacetate reductase [Rhizobium sp. CSW-27]
MNHEFTYEVAATTIVFGAGRRHETAQWMARLGKSRAFVLSTPNQADDALGLADELGTKAAGCFTGAAMHTPVDVTQAALAKLRDLEADCIVSIGGGSTTGLGKAIAYRTGLAQIVLPTTYAGSEVTPILGQTENGLKTTLRDARILPNLVIYDPELTIDLPVAMTVLSALNALAHAMEGLYARDRNPISTLMALEAFRSFKRCLPGLVENSRDLSLRAEAQYGCWLDGTVLGSVGMALHHKICHTLGGRFDTPHAETHAIMLPYTTAYNEVAALELLAPLGEIFGGSPGAALYDFSAVLGALLSLKAIELTEADLDEAAALASENLLNSVSEKPAAGHSVQSN